MSVKKPVVAVVFGTRPEAIKMATVVLELMRHPGLDVQVISTGQHRQMLGPILERFRIHVDHEMDLMEPNQSLFRLSSKALAAFEQALTGTGRPDFLLVQGDTTTAFLGALSAFYAKIPVGHVEAGLRTDNKYFPFPEEINRRMISVCADWHFCPTESNRENLLREGTSPDQILVTGNTGVDALLHTVGREEDAPVSGKAEGGKKLVLVTLHRRESFGATLEGVFHAIRALAEEHPDTEWVYPVHLNPNVQEPAHRILGDVPNIRLIAPMDYFEFAQLMKRAYLILTDSGGVQEEAPTLGIPVLVLRNETERPEAVLTGVVKLVGTDPADIARETRRLLADPAERTRMGRAGNPYGDGKASERIVAHVARVLGV
jgi:UDP-N-acetylglucosamine 2-epimerase (non-hydrolysing)